MFPKAGPLWKQTPISRALLSISFVDRNKWAISPGSPRRNPSERDALILEPCFIHLSKSPVLESPSRIPSGTPMERVDHLQSLFYISSRVPSKEVPPPGSPHSAPSERDAPLLSPLHPALESLVNESNSRFPSGVKDLLQLSLKVPSETPP
jgi:hypothetical protein